MPVKTNKIAIISKIASLEKFYKVSIFDNTLIVEHYFDLEAIILSTVLNWIYTVG